MTRKTFDRIQQVRMRNAMWIRASHLEELSDKRSRREAFRLIQRAVSLGATDAQGSLANAYDCGRGVRPSRKMSVHLYRKAWRNGHPPCARNLGITMLAEGRTSSAILWFRRAIASGDPDAQLDLAKVLIKYPSCLNEARRLLEAYIAAGPQELYEIRPVGSFPRVNESVWIEDEGLKGAKLLLSQLKGAAVV